MIQENSTFDKRKEISNDNKSNYIEKDQTMKNTYEPLSQ